MRYSARLALALGALVLWLSVVAPSCGGDGLDAPESPPAPDCRQVDDYLASVFALMERGALDHLRRAVSEEIPEDARRDLVSALLRLAAGFEEGTFSALAGVFAASDVAAPGGVQQTLGRLVRWGAATGPGAPYPDVLAALRGVLATCEGPPALALLADLVRDDALLRAAADLLATDALAEALAGLELDGTEGSEALRLLMRNLMVAATSPDFELATLLDLVAVVVDLEVEPWPGLVAGLERHLGPGPGVVALQELLGCALAVDPDASLGPMLWDLLVEAPVDLSGVVGALPPAGEPVLEPGLVTLVAGTFEFLADDAEARRALVAVGVEILREGTAPGVLVDVADLLDAGALGDVVAMVAALATGACE